MSSATAGYGTLLQRGTKPSATLSTGSIPGNTGIKWTAADEGTGGNSVRVAIVNPGGTNPDITISVAGNDVTINAATSAGAITSTAAQIIAAVNAHNDAMDKVSAANDGASTGAGVVTAFALTLLAGATDVVTYATIAEVRNISGPNLALGTVETTHQASTGAYREHIATLVDGGEITFELNFVVQSNTQNWVLGLIRDVRRSTLRLFQLIFTDAGTETASFSAFVTAFADAAPVDGKLTANVTVKISSSVTFA